MVVQEKPPTLTRREREVLTFVADGFSDKETARHFGTSVKTVATQVQSAVRKLDAHSRAHAVAMLIRTGVIT